VITLCPVARARHPLPGVVGLVGYGSRAYLSGMPASSDARPVRLAELVAVLSYGADLGLGQPMHHCLRQTVIAMRLAELLGVDGEQRSATYYLGMLMNAYCHADATEQAAWFGDEIAFKAAGVETLGMNTAQIVAFMLRGVAGHGSARQRAKRLASFPVAGQRALLSFPATHSTLGSQFAKQIGMDDTVGTAVAHCYEQWDGKGQPQRLRGDQISLPARIVQLAGPVETFARRHGMSAAIDVARKQRGRMFDPTVVDALCDNAASVLDALDEASSWDAIVDAEPGMPLQVVDDDLDQVLEAMADLVDLKTPCTAGHSRGVANLAAEAARVAGMGAAQTDLLRRAGWVHDLGRLGVPNTIWEKPGTLTAAEFERARMHAYLTERTLAQVSALDQIRRTAARHHERLDGSGYPHGLDGTALGPADRLLAAADAYHAMTEPRPHRPALNAGDAADRLHADVRSGRLDGEAVHAVLAAAGHRVPAAAERPGGLTSRETDVLQLLARGHTNRQIAQRLGISPKTVSNHVEHLYSKLGVSSRAAATLYATQHGLTGHFRVGQ
jgi:HD-GYP domain-containing protein (c-di-GMP phosphodiesterase class II)